jgi:uncharacterized protein YbjT (DUF2867 family)
MTTVLVTGGTGALGQQLVPGLIAAGYEVRSASRHPQSALAHRDATNVFVDIRSGEGLEAAIRDVDVVVHAATSPFRRTKATEVGGTKRLLEAASGAGVQHVIYVSIVGVDRTRLPYYKSKLAAERVVEAGSVPWTILRATQFHSLLDRLLGLPAVPASRNMRFQPIDAREVATRLTELVAAEPQGRVDDLGGPEVLTMAELSDTRRSITGKRTRLVRAPCVWFARDFAAGTNLAPDHRYGRTTWSEWLSRRARGA